MDVSVILSLLNKAENITTLLSLLVQELTPLGVSYEILTVDGGSTDETVGRANATDANVRVVRQTGPGYGQALRDGFAAA